MAFLSGSYAHNLAIVARERAVVRLCVELSRWLVVGLLVIA